jgi:hypothetical protein
MAARIRHLGPRLTSALRRRFPDVSGIRCEVIIVHGTPSRSGSARRITPTAKQALGTLAGSLPGGTLKTALEHLLQSAERSHREDQPLQREEREPDRGNE